MIEKSTFTPLRDSLEIDHNKLCTLEMEELGKQIEKVSDRIFKNANSLS